MHSSCERRLKDLCETIRLDHSLEEHQGVKPKTKKSKVITVTKCGIHFLRYPNRTVAILGEWDVIPFISA